MYCKTCGKKIPDDSKYCPHCGTNVSDLPFSDTDKRNDTELHVEYMRMTPSGEEVLTPNLKSDNAPNWIRTFASATSIICVLGIFLSIVTLVLYHVLDWTGSHLRFKEIWTIIIGVFVVIGAGMNFGFHFADRQYSLKNNRLNKKNIAIKSIVWRSLQLFFGLLVLGCLVTFSVFAMSDATIITKNLTIFRAVPTAVIILYIIVSCPAINFLNAYASKKITKSTGGSVVSVKI